MQVCGLQFGEFGSIILTTLTIFKLIYMIKKILILRLTCVACVLNIKKKLIGSLSSTMHQHKNR
jgi:hypothetical protein